MSLNSIIMQNKIAGLGFLLIFKLNTGNIT